MALKKGVFLFIALYYTCLSGKVYSQAAYVNTFSGIYQLTGGIGSTDRVLIKNDCGTVSNLLSMAVYKDTVYYNTWSGELKRFKIGVPGSCETLINGGPFYNALTIDKNGIVYMAYQELVRFDPHTKTMTNLGELPFFSGGDMIFFKDKLLLAGWDPFDWSTGIYEINLNDIGASRLYMATPAFIGLLAYPSSCGANRYFGLFADIAQITEMIEIDLINKTIAGTTFTIPTEFLDAASTAEMGFDDGIAINTINKKNPIDCGSIPGSININASSVNTPLTYTLINTGSSQMTGNFSNLQGGTYNFRITNTRGCTKDTSVTLTENNTPACKDFFIPNAFTPNYDGKNDLFMISFPPSAKDLTLQIFNRWGTEVYAAKGSNIAWDGSYKGAQQPTGVYIYTIIYTDQTGMKKNLKGTLTLLR